MRRLAVVGVLLLGVSAAPVRATVQWPLPVPRNVTIDSMDDFHGVIYRMGDYAFQIDAVGWVIQGHELSMGYISGYLEDGTEFSYTRTFPPVCEIDCPPGGGEFQPALWVDDVSGFGGFRLHTGMEPLYVYSMTWGTDQFGFLRIVTVNGVTNFTHQPFSIEAEEGPCAQITAHQTCRNVNCLDWPSCPGGPPSCSCRLGGRCESVTAAYCGSVPCPANEKCNNDPQHCRCVPLIPDPPDPPDPPQPPNPPLPGPPPPPVTLERCPSDFHVDPVAGTCTPDICFVCIYGY